MNPIKPNLIITQIVPLNISDEISLGRNVSLPSFESLKAYLYFSFMHASGLRQHDSAQTMSRHYAAIFGSDIIATVHVCCLVAILEMTKSFGKLIMIHELVIERTLVD